MARDKAEAIRAWMRLHVKEHVDTSTGEVNCTSLTAAWDSAEDSGKATRDPLHIAWDIAVKVAEDYEASRKYPVAGLTRGRRR